MSFFRGFEPKGKCNRRLLMCLVAILVAIIVVAATATAVSTLENHKKEQLKLHNEQLLSENGALVVVWVATEGGEYQQNCAYFGNDLQEVPFASSVGQAGRGCLQLCAQLSGCNHVTWANYGNGGTCYLKQGDVSKEDASVQHGQVCGIGFNWIFTSAGEQAEGCTFLNASNNVLEISSILRENCPSLCGQVGSPCTHWAWKPIQNGLCVLKQGAVSRANAYPEPGGVCGLRGGSGTTSTLAPTTLIPSTSTPISIWVPTAGGEYKQNCAYFGNDLQAVPFSSSVGQAGPGCLELCAQKSGCNHITWLNNGNGGTCYLKQGTVSKEGAFALQGQVCGIGFTWVSTSAGEQAEGCTFLNASNNVLEISSIMRENCPLFCGQVGSCTHWAWRPTQSGLCVLKQGAANRANAYPEPGGVCGLKGGSGTTTTLAPTTLTPTTLAPTTSTPSGGWLPTAGGQYKQNCAYFDYDLEQVPFASSVGQAGPGCLQLCAQRSGCNHITWANYGNGGTCYLKYTVDVSKEWATVQQGQVCGIGFTWVSTSTGEQAEGCTFLDASNTLVEITSIPRETCPALCMQFGSPCTHWAWRPTQGGLCVLKQAAASRENAYPEAGGVCGLVGSSDGWVATTGGVYKQNCAFWDYDLEEVPFASSVGQAGPGCLEVCAKKTGCNHITWANYGNGGTCYLKKAVGVSKEDSYSTSAEQGMVCGIGFTWVATSAGQVAGDCTFLAGGLNLDLAADQCPTVCKQGAVAAACTHWSWQPSTAHSNGLCVLRTGAASKADAYPAPSGFCGLV